MTLIHPTFLKRLQYQSWHRGTREMDLILGRFADAVLDTLSSDEQQMYAELLNESDLDLFYWITKDSQIFESKFSSLLLKIKEFHFQQRKLHHA